MPVVVPALRLGGVLQPRSVPDDALILRVANASYTYFTPDDLFASNPDPAIGRNIFAGTLSVPSRFAGMHYHSQVPPILHGLVRNVDCSGCHWSDIEVAPGSYQWKALDAFVATAFAAGRDVVYCFLATPNWASARPTEAGHYNAGSDAEPGDPVLLGQFAAAVAARYVALGTPIHAFEIWNEPKFDDGGGVAQGNYFTGTPSSLAKMARAVAQAVKAIDPGAIILSPSPTGLEYAWTEGDRSGTDQLNRFLGAADGGGGTGARWLDAVAFHGYSHNGYNNEYAIPLMADNVRASMALHGLAGRELWITETSAIAPTLFSYVPQHQEEFIARTMLLSLGAGVRRVVWYAWDDPLGFDQRPQVAASWNTLVALLSGATVTLVNSLVDKRVAAVINGARYLV